MILNNKSLKNKKGTTLIEALVAIGLLSIALSSIAYMIAMAFKQQTKVLSISSSSAIVTRIINNVRAQPSLYQRSFETVTNTLDLLDEANLQIAWSDDYYGPLSGCIGCPGLAGFVLRPIDGFQGIQLLIIRLTHSTWTMPKDYRILIAMN